MVLRINKFALVTQCPTKKECKQVPPASCTGNSDCTCTPLPPDECKSGCLGVDKEVCGTLFCKKCVSCEQVPDCSIGCGDGFCDGTAGERCEEDCTRTCPERFVPRCVPARPVRSKTPDDERKKKKKKGHSSGSDSDSDSSSGSDSDSSSGSDSDSSNGYDSDSDSSGCGSDSDSDDCYRKRHH